MGIVRIHQWAGRSASAASVSGPNISVGFGSPAPWWRRKPHHGNLGIPAVVSIFTRFITPITMGFVGDISAVNGIINQLITWWAPPCTTAFYSTKM